MNKAKLVEKYPKLANLFLGISWLLCAILILTTLLGFRDFTQSLYLKYEIWKIERQEKAYNYNKINPTGIYLPENSILDTSDFETGYYNK